MARQVFRFAQTTFPTGTKAAFTTAFLTMPVRIVRRIEARVPPGPRGVLGFALGFAGQVLIPQSNVSVSALSNDPTAWFVGDNDLIVVDVDEAPDTGAWQYYAWNIGGYSHTVYLTFHVDLPKASPSIIIPAAFALTGSEV